MAQELRSINLVAPAFKGINTEDSPIAQDPSFAEIADNAVIDKRGRIAARKGYSVITTNKTALGTDSIRAVKEFKESGTNKIFSVGNNKILSGTTALVDETPASYTISNNNWKLVSFNDNLYFFQDGQEPLVYNNSSDGVEKMSDVSGASASGSIPQANEAIAAYGRLWCADTSTNTSTVYWSDLLIGQNWTGGTSGSIDISKVWPDGYDEIVALAAHNGFLIIFGKHSIVVYQGAEAPATMSLADTVAGVGCVDRDTVQHTGTDVIFLSHTGLRSFGRTIQEKSMPVSTLSKTITKDIINLLQDETEYYRSAYSPEENFYLLTFVGQNTTYCFDLRGKLEDGSLRVTRWPGSVFTAYTRLEDGTLYVGTSDGIGSYTTYSDNGSSYLFKYYSPSLTFGDPSRLKLLKKIKPTLVGSNTASLFIKFAYDFNTTYSSTKLTLGNQTPAYFNQDEYASYSELSGYGISSTFNGEEAVTNGGFDSDTDWNKSAGWNISGGTANNTGWGPPTNLTQSSSIIAGRQYQVTYTVLNRTSGNIKIYVGSTDATSVDRNADGTYTETHTASGNSIIYIQGTNNFIGSIDNVSVKEINANNVTFADGSIGTYFINKYLGEFASAPTTGSGGGALLDGDSYFNTTEDKYYVYISSAFTDLSTLTPTTSSEFTGGELTTQKNLNATGNGSTVVIGLEAPINGSALSLQEINVQALIGKTV